MQFRTRVPIVLAAVAAIYCVLPIVFGALAERYAMQFLDQENNTLGKVMGLNMSFERYHRGWFGSTAVLVIEKKNADGSGYDLLKRIPLTIEHGPFYETQSGVRAGLASMVATAVSVDLLPKYHFDFRNDIGFNNERALLSVVSNKDVDVPSIADADVLTLSMKGNLDADHFVFRLNGNGLRYQSPDHVVSASIQALSSTLRVNYLSDRHWQLQWGLLLDKNKLSLGLLKDSAPVVVGADEINLTDMHFDTEKMADLLSKVLQIKSANEEGQVVPASAWIAMVQQFLTQVINNDTSIRLRDLSVTSPQGQVLLHYDASFPSLPNVHDYFDISERGVTAFAVAVPNWTYIDNPSNTEFGLSNLKLTTQNNTVFSHQMNLDVGAFDIKDTKTGATGMPVLYVTGLSYQGHNFGDMSKLSQVMRWKANRLCFTADCFSDIHGQLDLSNMNFSAFRGIATATQEVVQFDPQQTESMNAKWTNLADAYLALVTPTTKVVLSHDMKTSAGDLKLYAEAGWPKFMTPPNATPDMNLFLDDMVYEVRAELPVAYLQAFIAADMPQLHGKTPEKTVDAAPPIETQAIAWVRYAITQRYLKKVGDAYVLDLVGQGPNATLNGIPWKAPDAPASASSVVAGQ
jgi:hypothetical protein